MLSTIVLETLQCSHSSLTLLPTSSLALEELHRAKSCRLPLSPLAGRLRARRQGWSPESLGLEHCLLGRTNQRSLPCLRPLPGAPDVVSKIFTPEIGSLVPAILVWPGEQSVASSIDGRDEHNHKERHMFFDPGLGDPVLVETTSAPRRKPVAPQRPRAPMKLEAQGDRPCCQPPS